MAELPPKVAAVIERAKAVIAAAEACDREAERHPSSRSSAPVVRYINAMKRLRESILALETGDSRYFTDPPFGMSDGEAREADRIRAEQNLKLKGPVR